MSLRSHYSSRFWPASQIAHLTLRIQPTSIPDIPAPLPETHSRARVSVSIGRHGKSVQDKSSQTAKRAAPGFTRVRIRANRVIRIQLQSRTTHSNSEKTTYLNVPRQCDVSRRKERRKKRREERIRFDRTVFDFNLTLKHFFLDYASE